MYIKMIFSPDVILWKKCFYLTIGYFEKNVKSVELGEGGGGGTEERNLSVRTAALERKS